MASDSIVRNRAGSILAEAAIMLVVGFYFFHGGLGGSDLTDYAAVATVWTFRLGGIALIVVGLLCLANWRESLLANAVLDLVIGLLFAVSGAILLMGGGPTGLLIGLFGLMSLGSARWDWNAWRSVRAIARPAVDLGGEESIGIPQPEDDPVDADRAASRADALRRVVEQKRAIPRAMPREESPAEPKDPSGSPSSKDRPTDAPPRPPIDRIVPRPDEPPPEGFLADFGRDDAEDK